MAKKKSPVKRVSKATGLLEAWLGYIYNDHYCSKGLLAAKFLRECLQKGLLTNYEVWNAASAEIQQGFREQFGSPKLSPKARAIEQQAQALDRAIALVTDLKSPGRKALQAERKVLAEKFVKLTPNVVPGVKGCHYNRTLLLPSWGNK